MKPKSWNPNIIALGVMSRESQHYLALIRFPTLWAYCLSFHSELPCACRMLGFRA